MKLPIGYVAGKGVVKATAYGGYGQKMLERMGWEKGQGLGKESHGITQAIEVKKKEDVLGIGAEVSWDWNWKYWEDAYNTAVKTVDDGATSDDSDSSSDEELPTKNKTSVAQNRDGTVTSASQAELKLNAQLAKDPWGRWGGRGGKMARIREQEAAEAAQLRSSLGLPPLPTASAPGASSSSCSESSSESESENKTKSKKRKEKKGTAKKGEKAAALEPAAPDTKKRVVIILSIKDDPSKKKYGFKQTPCTGWWGDKYFISSGAMSSIEDEAIEAQKQRQAFDEGDQEALYMQAHDHQRVGRRGLGKSTTLKIAGGKWEGTKVTFDDVDGEKKSKGGVAMALMATQALSDEEQALGDKDGKKKGNGGKKRRSADVDDSSSNPKSKPSKKHKESAKECPETPLHDDEGPSIKCKKWVKVARRLLKKAPERRLKARLLMEQLRLHAGLSSAGAKSPSSKSQLRRLLCPQSGQEKARQIMELDGKYVILKPSVDTKEA